MAWAKSCSLPWRTQQQYFLAVICLGRSVLHLRYGIRDGKLIRQQTSCCNDSFKLVQYVAEALVDFANLTRHDTLFDLGCNDGTWVETGAAGALRCSRPSAVLRQGCHNSCQADCCKRSWYRIGRQSSCEGTTGCSKWQECHDACCCWWQAFFVDMTALLQSSYSAMWA